MLSVIGGALRILIGFALACLAAGFVQVLFAVTPAELVEAGDDRIGEAVTWGLLSATQIAVFAAPFALIAALLSEWQGIRSFAFHAMVAMAISVAGFGLIYASESATEASIVNSYAMAAYLTSGFIGGLVYWLFAGCRANRSDGSHVRMETDRKPAPQSPKSASSSPSPAPAPQKPSSTAAPATAVTGTRPTTPQIPKQSGSSSA